MPTTDTARPEGSPVLSPDLREVAGRAPAWVVDHSSDRTLVARARPGSPVIHLFKLFERGTVEDALAEIRLGYRLQHDGVVQYEDAGIDPITGKPCVVMRYHDGLDLEQAVARFGPFPEATAARVGRDLARILDHLHTTRIAGDAPSGVVHRDVKPRNVIFREGPGPVLEHPILLLDFEHALAVGKALPSDRGFSGATHGYAPPESYTSAPPSPAFDVFGLGALIYFLLTGRGPFDGGRSEDVANRVARGHVRPPSRVVPTLSAELDRLVLSCLAPDPARRPRSAQDVVQALERILLLPRPVAVQDAADLFLEGRCLEAGARLAGVPGSEPVVARMTHAAAVLERVEPRLLHTADGLEAARATVATPEDKLDPAATGRACAALSRKLGFLGALLSRFPRHQAAAHQKDEAVTLACALLAVVPRTASDLRKATRFSAAEELVHQALELAGALRMLPVSVLDPRSDSLRELFTGRDSSRARRDLFKILQATLSSVSSDRRIHEQLLGQLYDHEAHMDLAGAQQVLDRISETFSGANEAAAELRDRIHRIRWYAQRCLEFQGRLPELAAEWTSMGVAADLQPLEAFFTHLKQSMDSEGLRRTPPGISGFLRILTDFGREFPRIEPTLKPARAALTRTLEQVTRRVDEWLVEITSRLTAEPIPIRHLLDLLRRADRIAALDSLVDLPDKPRARLREELDDARARVEEAKDRRDRIAENARADLRRGHVTTALFDLQRAAEAFSDLPTSEAPAEGGEIQRDLQEARRIKQAMELAARRNLELQSLYARLQDQVPGNVEERILCLEQREKALQVILRHLPPDRAGQYAQDLRDVHVAVLAERAGQAERDFEAAQSGDERFRIARDILRTLGGGMPEETSSGEVVGRVKRLQEAWESRLRRSEKEQRDAEQRAQLDRQAMRRRRVATIARWAGAILLLTAVWCVARWWR